MSKARSLLPLFVAIVIAAVFKAWLILTDAIPFNGDEAVVGLMARDIIEGDRPVFFYGQAYMGSLDAWLISFIFRIFGDSVISIRITQAILYVIYIVSLWILTSKLFNDRLLASSSALLASIPTVTISLYTTATLGGYVESIILGNLILWLGYELLYKNGQHNWKIWAALGLSAGLAFWTLAIAGVYLAPLALLLISRIRTQDLKFPLLAGILFFLASSPWWLYNLQNHWAAFESLRGPFEPSISLLGRAFAFAAVGLPALIGLRNPWLSSLVPFPASFFLLFFLLSLLAYLVIKRKDLLLRRDWLPIRFLLFFVLCFALIFVLSSFGSDATGRYLLPLYTPFLIALALALRELWYKKKGLAIAALFFALSFNGFLTYLAALDEEGITTQLSEISRFNNIHDEALIDFLFEQNATRGYSNHWVSYRLAFLTNEQIILSPELPFKEDIDLPVHPVRIPAYPESARQTSNPVFISSKHPLLDNHLRQSMLEANIAFSEQKIGPYTVFYELSEILSPLDLGFKEQDGN